MKWHLYRGLVTILVFAGALVFFTMQIRPETYRKETILTQMAEPALPLVRFARNGKTVNLRLPYANEASAEPFRDHVMPLVEADAMLLAVQTRGIGVTAARARVYDAAGNFLFESEDEPPQPLNEAEDSGEDTENGSGTLRATVTFTEPLEAGKDYRAVIILTLENGKTASYPTVVRYVGADHFADNVAFTDGFRMRALGGAGVNMAPEGLAMTDEELAGYLDTVRFPEADTLSYVNIESTPELVCWEGFVASVVSEPEIRVTENNKTTTALTYTYLIWDREGQIYDVDEYFRVQFTEQAIYLLAYERHMTPRTKAEYAGASNGKIAEQAEDTLFTFTANADGTKAAAVRQGTLWYYDLADSENGRRAVKVFSFLSEPEKGENDAAMRILQHDIRILHMEEDGNLDFAVTGYMNRGVYEGQIAVVLYHFFPEEMRIEELLYIPSEAAGRLAEEELRQFIYMSADRYFYFSVNDRIYAYSLVRKELSEICDEVSRRALLFLPAERLLVWQESAVAKENTKLVLFDPELREERTIKAPSGQAVRMLGSVLGNLVYGYADPADVYTDLTGEEILPLSVVYITTTEGEVLKRYIADPYYVTDVAEEENLIHLFRVKKTENGTFSEAEEDQILNQGTSLPTRSLFQANAQGLSMDASSVTVIASETRLRVPGSAGGRNQAEDGSREFAAVIYGKQGAFSGIHDLADLIKKADAGMGYVIDGNGRAVWQRGVTASSVYLEEAEKALLEGTVDGLGQSAEAVAPAVAKAYDAQIFDLEGITFTEAMYYVTEGIPVVADRKNDVPVLVIGYDSSGITYYNCGNGGIYSLSREQAEKNFAQAGNHYFCFLR